MLVRRGGHDEWDLGSIEEMVEQRRCQRSQRWHRRPPRPGTRTETRGRVRTREPGLATLWLELLAAARAQGTYARRLLMYTGLQVVPAVRVAPDLSEGGIRVS